MDDTLARALADAGCFMVNMAIESGNEQIRNNIMKKGFSTEQIFKAYRIVHDHGMITSSFNMIGTPGESRKTIWETIEINRALKPSRILCTIFMPLPGTALGDYCKNNNLMTHNLHNTTNYYSQVAVKNPKLSPYELIGYQGFFDWYVLLPKQLHWLVHILRFIYQSLVSPSIPQNPLKRKIREIIVETIYQMKRFLPDKKLHVKIR